jgi:DNA-binding winged helix-turn-helix (wHTH) protein/tetratricopeptide (TPR) repeat protein/TolB-like protein
MGKQNGHQYEFGSFKADGIKRRLLRDGSVVPLTPKVFETLLVLLRNNGEVVDKATLMNHVWPDTAVEESGLTRNISVLRKMLGEGPGDHDYIVTVPGRGYRFVAPVNQLSEESCIDNGETEDLMVDPEGEDRTEGMPDAVAVEKPIREIGAIDTSAAKPYRHSRSGMWLSFAVLITLTLATASFVLTRQDASSAPVSTFAILPFMPIDGDRRDPLLEMAIAESLILKLSADKNFNVRPLSAVRRFIDLDKDPFDVGRQLKADFVLSSNYQLVNGRIRVTSQLLDVRAGQTRHTFRSEGDAADPFSMQDSVANDIGNGIFEQFGRAQTAYEAKRGTPSEEAYRLYLQGMYLVDKKTRQDAKRAIELLDEAIRLDPQYGNAWAGKAAAHCTFAHMGGIEPKLGFASAKPAIARALELAPNSAETHAVLGIISFDYDWEFEKGLAHFRRALEIDPKHEMARRWHANRLASQGKYDEALAEIKTLIDINPSGLFQQWDLANILYQSRRFDEATVQIGRVLELDPNLAWANNLVWVSSHLDGDHAQAYKRFMDLQENSKIDPAELTMYRNTFKNAGWPGVLRQYSELSNKRFKKNEYDPAACQNLLVACLIGDLDTAFMYVDVGLKNRDLWVPFLLNDPAFENLRADPRFPEYRKRGGF